MQEWLSVFLRRDIETQTNVFVFIVCTLAWGKSSRPGSSALFLPKSDAESKRCAAGARPDAQNLRRTMRCSPASLIERSINTAVFGCGFSPRLSILGYAEVDEWCGGADPRGSGLSQFFRRGSIEL